MLRKETQELFDTLGRLGVAKGEKDTNQNKSDKIASIM